MGSRSCQACAHFERLSKDRQCPSWADRGYHLPVVAKRCLLLAQRLLDKIEKRDCAYWSIFSRYSSLGCSRPCPGNLRLREHFLASTHLVATCTTCCRSD